MSGSVRVSLMVAVGLALSLGLASRPALMLGCWALVALAGLYFHRRFKLDWGLTLMGFLAVIALAAPVLAPYAAQQNFAEGTFLLGSDRLGRDLFSRLLLGHRNTIAIALLGCLAANALALIAGAAMVLGPRWLRKGFDTFIQVFLSLPLLIYYLICLAFLRPGWLSLVLLLGCTLWPEPARLLQARVAQLDTADFVQAARMRGWPEWRVFRVEMLPNLRPVFAVNFLVTLTNAVLLESILSYLGLGLPLGTPSLGNMIEYGAKTLDRQPQILIFAIALLLAWLLGLRGFARRLGERERPLLVQ